MARVAPFVLVCAAACVPPRELRLPDGVSPGGTSLLALELDDPASSSGVELRLVGRPAPDERETLAFMTAKTYALELAVFDLAPDRLGLDGEIETVAPTAENAGELPLGFARRFYTNAIVDGEPGVWVEVDEPPKRLAATRVPVAPISCPMMVIDAIELDDPAKQGLIEAHFLERLPSGEILIGTQRAVYTFQDEVDGWTTGPLDLLTESIEAGSRYRSAFVASDGTIWLGGANGRLDHYDLENDVLTTVTASTSGLPDWTRLEGNADASELYASGVLLGTGGGEAFVAELVRDGAPRWSATSLGDIRGNRSVVDLAYDGDGVLLTRESPALSRFAGGMVSNVPSLWDGAVHHSVASKTGGTLVAASVNDVASFAFRAADGRYVPLGQTALTDPFVVQPFGDDFLFAGRAAWVGIGSSAEGRAAICPQRISAESTDKHLIAIIDDHTFLVGGLKARFEETNVWRVRLP